jgi:predicted nucleotidyltransferase
MEKTGYLSRRQDKYDQRISLKGTTKIPIDLIPFGGVAEGDTIAWPPDRDTVITVAGFEDALAASVQVQVNATLSLPVVSLAALAILKLFAWQDRKTNDKDALDSRSCLQRH